ncbi:hypothetical protein [Paenibacillus sp. Marseille-Q4541]|uniref:hypothetical protein n=1 Tax=Paenibacillus sp. Marseille-Q4541 TaxID=2831522 RepID=UPI001BA442D3|nr:hypothetical protein [Paenibacillus sp. Marseille-Q4541]
MKILVGQPKLEKDVIQLEEALRQHPEAEFVFFPEGYLNENVEKAKELARSHQVTLITGYRKFHKNPKDQVIIIGNDGQILLDRPKYTAKQTVQVKGYHLGVILCDELVLQGMDGVRSEDIDILFHPIGVGMFSHEQYDEWVHLACQIAKELQCVVVGTSHADGSYKDNPVSIPITYLINASGEVIKATQNEIRNELITVMMNKNI